MLASYAPLRARKFWTLINALLCLWSILLLIELLFISTPLERLESTQAYLAYNFGTTLAWVIEVCLNLCDHYRNRRRRRRADSDGRLAEPSVATVFGVSIAASDVELVLEAVVALYFLVDSVRMFRVWQDPDQDVNVEFWTTFLTGGFYMYQVVRLRTAEEETETDEYVEIL